MRWETKAAIMRMCASLPLGERLYRAGQKSLGRLKGDPLARFAHQAEIVRSLVNHGIPISGSCFFEVGTGHVPLVPIGFFLLGASRVFTADLHKRIEWGLTRDCLLWLASHRAEVLAMCSGIADVTLLEERVEIVKRWQNSPQRFLREAGWTAG